MLKCIAGAETSDTGTIYIANGYKLVYVEQDIHASLLSLKGFELLYRQIRSDDLSQEDIDTLLAFFSLQANPASYTAEQNDEVTGQLYALYHVYELYEASLELCNRLQLPVEKLYKKISELSGGEKKKVALIAALLQQPDILLLDEPTNHLDAYALRYLSGHLKVQCHQQGRLSVLLVTHDRYFMDQTCDQVLELEQGRLARYSGNYARYTELKAERMHGLQKEAERLEARLRTETDWMNKQPR